MVNFAAQRLPAGAIVDGEIANTNQVQKVLLNLLRPHDSRHHRSLGVFASLPEKHTFIKTIAIPSTPRQDLAEAVRWETTQHIPYDLRDLSLDWTIVERASVATTHALVASAPQTLTETMSAVIERAGYTPLALEPPALSVYRACAHLFTESDVTILAALNERESTALVVERKTPLFASSLHISTTELENEIGSHFHLQPNEAKKALRLLGLLKNRAKGVIRDMLLNQFNHLAERLREIEAFYRDHYAATQPIRRVVLSGIGASIPGLRDELAKIIQKDVSLATLPPGISISKHAKGFEKSFLEYGGALGLALRSARNHHV